MNCLARSATLVSLLSSRASAFTSVLPQKASPALERMPRRSVRIRKLHVVAGDNNDILPEVPPPEEMPKAKKRRTAETLAKSKPKKQGIVAKTVHFLPRNLESNIYKTKSIEHVIGIDEAGRGPLAGPVVAAAVIIPKDAESISGIVDSKKITKEEDRESLFQQLMKVPDIRWAVCVVDAKRIDEINILQATLEAMRSTAMALVDPEDLTVRIVPEISVQHDGCYVVTSESKAGSGKKCKTKTNSESYYSLIDGNKIPKDMPCEADCVVKGDGKEYAIAAASILAKVSRDNLMHSYHEMYPQFEFSRHKGYPTAAHIAAINVHGTAPIHRLTFAPIKHMNLENKVPLANKKKR
eukprot:scaffold783_cov118-Cylindrotheca_fusiformis.AAC.6